MPSNNKNSDKRPDLGGIKGPQSLANVMYRPKYLGISKTLKCKIITSHGTTQEVRALIDGGSQITAIKKSIAHSLGLKGPKRTLEMGTSGAQTVIYPNMIVVNFQLASLDGSFVTDYDIEAITMPEVTHNINKITINPNNYKHLKQIRSPENIKICI